MPEDAFSLIGALPGQSPPDVCDPGGAMGGGVGAGDGVGDGDRVGAGEPLPLPALRSRVVEPHAVALPRNPAKRIVELNVISAFTVERFARGRRGYSRH